MIVKITTYGIKVGDHFIKTSTSAHNIAAAFDANMQMEQQVNSVCQAAWYHLNHISKIRLYISTDQTKTVRHAYAI